MRCSRRLLLLLLIPLLLIVGFGLCIGIGTVRNQPMAAEAQQQVIVQAIPDFLLPLTNPDQR